MKKLYSNVLLLSLLSVTSAQAASFDDIGYTRLQTELGVALPDGADVKVSHVEGSFGTANSYVPDTGLSEFVGKNFTDVTSVPNGVSSHATEVGLRFYGIGSSTSPSITNIDLYHASVWMGANFLRTTEALDPNFTAARVANHSWYSDVGTLNGEVLRRLDYVVDVDEFIQVVSTSVSPGTADTGPLLSSSFNAIVTRTIYGNIGTTALDSIYTSGRTRPDLVAPEVTASAAVPRVASAAALLIDYANTTPSLSTDPSAANITNRNGDVISNAARSETIKAVLMAGADRVKWGNTNVTTKITTYRVDPAFQASNGLDTRVGAGQLNIYNSYHILAAGEQNSAEDLPGNLGTIANQGFDYDPSFGGASGSNATATYNFTTSANPGQKLKADLVWNLEILSPQNATTGTLYNLDLQLIDVTGGNTVVASSTSTIDNTENIWFDLVSNKSYRLEVIRGSGGPFAWDYALAWQIVVPGITVVETAGSTVTTEAAATADTFTLVLDSSPASDVVIKLVSSDTSEATISPASITFTNANWDTPQTVTLTGVDDAYDDGDIVYNVNFTVTSSDASYNGFFLGSLSASNVDDDVTPSVDGLQSFSINENSLVSTFVGTVAVTAPTSTVTAYTIFSGDAGGVFAIANNGDLTVAGVVDYETTTSYTLGIKASDGVNESPATDVAVTVINLDEIPPTVTSAQSFPVDENSVNATVVGTVIAIDAADAGGVVNGFNIVSGNTGNAFAISSNGVITVAGAIDYETTTSYTLSITATDNSANTSNPVNVIITVNNIDEIPPVVGLAQSFNVDENSANMTEVGTVIATDAFADMGGVVTGFNIFSGNVNNAFAIASNGVITVAGVIDYETTASYTLGITASDAVNTSAVVSVIVVVNDINESQGGGGGGGGSLGLMWWFLPFLIAISRRKISH